jgi:hypothetical protein
MNTDTHGFLTTENTKDTKTLPMGQEPAPPYLPDMPAHFSCAAHFTSPPVKSIVPHYRYFLAKTQQKPRKRNFCLKYFSQVNQLAKTSR